MSQQPLAAASILERAMATGMISAQQLHHLLHASLPRVVLLDVRTPVEHQQGIIPGSVLFPCDHDLSSVKNMAIFTKSFGEKFRPEAFDPTCHYVLICRTGPRMAVALEIFLRHHFTACELLGGVTEWQRQGLALQPVDAKAIAA
ncbi:MAG: hypothetical protein HQL87_09640 [Magnetococcales bacterium]|nr:hypothetical protein [Magnetococcales bacterium]